MTEKVKYNIIDEYENTIDKVLIVSTEQEKVIEWLIENGYINTAFIFNREGNGYETVDLS